MDAREPGPQCAVLCAKRRWIIMAPRYGVLRYIPSAGLCRKFPPWRHAEGMADTEPEQIDNTTAFADLAWTVCTAGNGVGVGLGKTTEAPRGESSAINTVRSCKYWLEAKSKPSIMMAHQGQTASSAASLTTCVCGALGRRWGGRLRVPDVPVVCVLGGLVGSGGRIVMSRLERAL